MFFYALGGVPHLKRHVATLTTLLAATAQSVGAPPELVLAFSDVVQTPFSIPTRPEDINYWHWKLRSLVIPRPVNLLSQQQVPPPSHTAKQLNHGLSLSRNLLTQINKLARADYEAPAVFAF